MKKNILIAWLLLCVSVIFSPQPVCGARNLQNIKLTEYVVMPALEKMSSQFIDAVKEGEYKPFIYVTFTAQEVRFDTYGRADFCMCDSMAVGCFVYQGYYFILNSEDESYLKGLCRKTEKRQWFLNEFNRFYWGELEPTVRYEYKKEGLNQFKLVYKFNIYEIVKKHLQQK